MDTAQINTGTAPVNPGLSDKEVLELDLDWLEIEAETVVDEVLALRGQLGANPQAAGQLIGDLRGYVWSLEGALNDVAEQLGISD